MLTAWLSTYRLEGRHIALATGNVVNNEATSGLPSVLVIEKIPSIL